MNQNALEAVAKRIIEKSEQNLRPDDLFDAEGFRLCPVCGERKEEWIDASGPFGGKRVVPCACRKKELAERDRERKRRQIENRIEELERRGVTDRKYRQYTFENDEIRDQMVSDYCRYYADNWKRMEENGSGILLYGSPGTGKTFYECCIVNRLIREKLVPAFVTSFPRILKMPIDRRNDIMEDIERCPLVAFDDLGAERETQYAIETVFHIVDTRIRSGLPTIFTTNLDLNELKNAASVDLKRIYDRVLAMCPVRLQMAGESRRAETAERMAAEERDHFAAWRTEQRRMDFEKVRG